MADGGLSEQLPASTNLINERITSMWQTYGKAIVALILALLTAAQAAVTDGHISAVEWVQIAIAGATAAGVWLVPLHPQATWAKSALAVLMAALSALVTLIVGGLSGPDVIALILAGLTVLAVPAVPAASTLSPRAVASGW